jgi:hypothetical protein
MTHEKEIVSFHMNMLQLLHALELKVKWYLIISTVNIEIQDSYYYEVTEQNQ